MKKYLLIFFACLFFVNLNAQNLVPNWSFEQYDTCPYSFGQFNNYVKFWWNPNNASSDYFNACSSPPTTTDVPLNGIGYQYAKTGNSYAGIVTGCLSCSDFREYVEIQLLDSLITEKKYCVSFYVCLANDVKYATDDFGVYISTNPISSFNNVNLSFSPQISNPSGNIVSDTLNWIEIYGEYVAGGGGIHNHRKFF